MVPRLIYYNDAHHFHAKRIDPPVSIHKLQRPVDEVLGTGVDCLVFGLGYGDVYFHRSKVGRVVGQSKDVWDSYIDWRIMRMVESAEELGTDQLAEVIKRGRNTGLCVFPSLKLQDSAPPGGERCGLLKWQHGELVCIGDQGRAKWCYDYACDLVRQDKLAIVREVLEDYRADGIELDFMFDKYYFRQSEIERNIPIMNAFVVQVRQLAAEVGRSQAREIPLMARVSADETVNLAMGLDVRAWLAAGALDYVVAQDERALLDTGIQASWLAQAAEKHHVAAFYRPPRRIYDHRVGVPDIEMYRALARTLDFQGYAGIYIGYLPWPFDHREYQVLREMGYPEVHSRSDKRYILAPKEGKPSEATTTPERQIPAELKEGGTVSLAIFVADDIESSRDEGDLRDPYLTIRFSFFCIEDKVDFRFNGHELSICDAEITDERALTIKLPPGIPVQAPLGMSAHWFRFRIPASTIVQGTNNLEIRCTSMSPAAGFTRSVNGIELQIRYNDMKRPEGLTMDRVVPGS